MLLRAVQAQGPTLVSVADAKASVQTLAEMQERLSHRSRRLTATAIVLVAAWSVAAVLGAVAVTVAWAADELGAAGRVAEVAADVRWPLWLLAGVLAAAAAVTELLEHRASSAAAVAGDGARTLEGLAVEVVAVRTVLATGVTRERCARAAASLRYQTLDGAHPHEQWALDAARFIEEVPGFGRARVLDPAERTTRDGVGGGR
jgi:hypothetical protein